jgi:DNA-binding NarL/FixJ family response regulator
MLGKHPELQVIGEAADGLEAVQKAEELQPDLIFARPCASEFEWNRGCSPNRQAGYIQNTFLELGIFS